MKDTTIQNYPSFLHRSVIAVHRWWKNCYIDLTLFNSFSISISKWFSIDREWLQWEEL